MQGDGSYVAVQIDKPAPQCPNFDPAGTPALGPRPAPVGPPAAGTSCPPGNGPTDTSAYSFRLYIGLDKVTDPLTDPEYQVRHPLVSLAGTGLDNTANAKQPPSINGVEDQTPRTALASQTIVQLEDHPGYTVASWIANSGTYDGTSSVCHVPVRYSRVVADLTTPVQVCCGPPPGAAVPPGVVAAADRIRHTWVTGTVSVSPSGTFVVFAPTCLWVTGGTVPRTPTTVVDWHLQPPPDPATGRQLWVEYILTLSPGKLHIDWGDGATDDVDASAATGPPASPPTDCGVTHTYRQVTGEAGTPPDGVQVRVTQTVSMTAEVLWFDGVTTHDTTVPLPQPPPLDDTPAPRPSHRVVQLEPVLGA